MPLEPRSDDEPFAHALHGGHLVARQTLRRRPGANINLARTGLLDRRQTRASAAKLSAPGRRKDMQR